MTCQQRANIPISQLPQPAPCWQLQLGFKNHKGEGTHSLSSANRPSDLHLVSNQAWIASYPLLGSGPGRSASFPTCKWLGWWLSLCRWSKG